MSLLVGWLSSSSRQSCGRRVDRAWVRARVRARGEGAGAKGAGEGRGRRAWTKGVGEGRGQAMLERARACKGVRGRHGEFGAALLRTCGWKGGSWLQKPVASLEEPSALLRLGEVVLARAELVRRRDEARRRQRLQQVGRHHAARDVLDRAALVKVDDDGADKACKLELLAALLVHDGAEGALADEQPAADGGCRRPQRLRHLLRLRLVHVWWEPDLEAAALAALVLDVRQAQLAAGP
eukprot:59616-Prymnesium_polylepis.1